GHGEEELAFHGEPVERAHEDRVIELVEVELSLQQQLQPREPRAPGPRMGHTDLGQAVPESGDALAQWNVEEVGGEEEQSRQQHRGDTEHQGEGILGLENADTGARKSSTRWGPVPSAVVWMKPP